VDAHSLSPSLSLSLYFACRCVVGFSANCTVGVRSNGGCCTCCFSGEGLFSTTLQGPGRVILQSMPLEKIRALFPQAKLMTGTTTKGAAEA